MEIYTELEINNSPQILANSSADVHPIELNRLYRAE